MTDEIEVLVAQFTKEMDRRIDSGESHNATLLAKAADLARDFASLSRRVKELEDGVKAVAQSAAERGHLELSGLLFALLQKDKA